MHTMTIFETSCQTQKRAENYVALNYVLGTLQQWEAQDLYYTSILRQWPLNMFKLVVF